VTAPGVDDVPVSLYLDQNYLSGIAKRKPAFRELEPVLRQAIDRGTLYVLESVVHERESFPRPDLGLLELLRGLSAGRRLPEDPDRAAREARRRMGWTIEHQLRRGQASRAPAIAGRATRGPGGPAADMM
jgi:hypothetical protein